jgi:hypothetical protein
MVCGWFIFYSTIESSTSFDAASAAEGGGIRGGGSIAAATTHEEEIPVIKMHEEPVFHPLQDPVPLIPRSPVEQDNLEKPLPNLNDLAKSKIEPQQPPHVPQPLLKTGEMWKLSVAEQRRYLQNLHQQEVEPSLKSANEFIQYAQQSFTLSPEDLPANDPVNTIWPYPSSRTTYDPQVGFGSPGQSKISYHIAGKDVKLPYGYPEESIFILTASYRDPEVASTIARAYAR